MKIGIYGRTADENNVLYIRQLIEELTSKGCELFIFEPYLQLLKTMIPVGFPVKTFAADTDVRGKFDYFFSIGGDGTLLSAVPIIRDTQIPIIGLNIGRLGFLSSISKDEITPAIEALMSKNYHIDKRTLICAQNKDNVFGAQNFGLNEFTVNKLDTSAMMMIEIELNNNFFSNYWADGLIISTPTGSTAYSLSCGGPVITPQCSNFVITPIAPHSLSVRPVVISDLDEIKIRIKSRSKRFLASLDSNFVNITTDAEFEIRKADFNLNLIRLSKLDYMSTLRSKLLWGSDARNSIKFAN